MKTLISKLTLGAFMWAALASGTLHAAVINFNTVVTGQTSFGFDGDGDGINDVIFSTTDPAGFNTVGPGAQQTYINEPGLEGTSTLNPDLRVDFLNGAIGPIVFGFALNSSTASPSYFASLRLFNAGGTEIGSASVPGAFTTTPSGPSTFPEGIVTVNFSGVASYGLFNFESPARYIIDNFEGTFGSTEPVPQIPEPTTAALLGLGLGGIVAEYRWSRRH